MPALPQTSFRSSLASFLLLPFFVDLLPLFVAGARRRLTPRDVSATPHSILALPAKIRLQSALACGDSSSPAYLARGLFKAFSFALYSPIPARLFLLAATFTQVWLVSAMTRYIASERGPRGKGWTLVVLYALAFATQAFATHAYENQIIISTAEVRAGLTAALYAKGLRLNGAEARDVGQAGPVALISVDIPAVASTLSKLHQIWASALSLVLALVYLWFEVRWAVFAPCCLIVTVLATTSRVGGAVGRLNRKLFAAVDDRVKLTSSVLAQLLPIKLAALEAPLSKHILDLRGVEMKLLRRYFILNSFVSALSNFGSISSLFVTLLAYALLVRFGAEGRYEPLALSKVFTVMAAVELIGGPIRFLGQSLPGLFSAWTSLQRVQAFLVREEKHIDLSEVYKDLPEPLVVLEEERTGPTVKLDRASFGWIEDSEVLTEVSLQLRTGLHVLVGPVASGKTTLLMSLLRETVLISGSIELRASKIAIATQTPCIFTGSIRDNILLDQPFDQVRYKAVIEACSLSSDLEALSEGDETLLGERETSLSGGQRSRVGTARAIYADAELVLLDDIFSSIDGPTEAHMFNALFGTKGLLLEKVVVLVSNSTRPMPSATSVIVLGDGSISHQSSYKDLVATDSSLLADALGSRPSTAADSRAGEEAVSTKSEAKSDDSEDEGDEWKGMSNLSAYKFLCDCTGSVQTGLYFSLLLVWGLIEFGEAWFIKDLAESNGEEALSYWLPVYGGICLTILLMMILEANVRGLLVADGYSPRLHLFALEGVLRSPPSWSTEVCLPVFTSDLARADRFLPFAVVNTSMNLLHLLTVITIFGIATPWVLLALPALLLSMAAFFRFYLKTSNQLQHLSPASAVPVFTSFSSMVSGLAAIRSFGAEAFCETRNARLIDESSGPAYYAAQATLFLEVYLLWLSSGVGLFMMTLAVYFRSSTSAGIIGLAITQLSGLAGTLQTCLSSMAELETAFVSVARVQNLAQLQPEEKFSSAFSEVNASTSSPDWPSVGKLSFKSVSMRYRAGLSPALTDVSFDVEAGTSIGICGRTGSGKSSLLLTLFRAIDPSLIDGQILLDGKDISTVPLHELRSVMSIVVQDPFLWQGTIRQNLDPELSLSDEKIWASLRSVEMSDAVASLPDKLDMVISDESSFSKGQRQLLCIARALLRGLKILVLDECSSSLDSSTREQIRRILAAQCRGITVVSVEHDIGSLVDADRILVLESGKVVESGVPAQLLRDGTSRFARLASAQGVYAKGQDE